MGEEKGGVPREKGVKERRTEENSITVIYLFFTLKAQGLLKKVRPLVEQHKHRGGPERLGREDAQQLRAGGRDLRDVGGVDHELKTGGKKHRVVFFYRSNF